MDILPIAILRGSKDLVGLAFCSHWVGVWIFGSFRSVQVSSTIQETQGACGHLCWYISICNQCIMLHPGHVHCARRLGKFCHTDPVNGLVY